MSRSFDALPTVQNVVKNGRATLSCPLGLTYDQIILKLTDLKPANLKNFKVITGSKSQWDLTDGQVIADLNTYYKRTEREGYLTLWFYRPEWATEEERSLCSMGTSDISSLTVQFDIQDATDAAGNPLPVGVSPAIEARAVRRAPSPMGLITKLKEFPTTFATGGRQDIDNIPRGPRINAFHLFNPGVDYVELEINNGSGAGKVVDYDKGTLELVQDQYKRTPLTAKATHIDLNLLGRIAQPMPTNALQDMRIRPTLAAAGGLTVLVEYIDTFNGI